MIYVPWLKKRWGNTALMDTRHTNMSKKKHSKVHSSPTFLIFHSILTEDLMFLGSGIANQVSLWINPSIWTDKQRATEHLQIIFFSGICTLAAQICTCIVFLTNENRRVNRSGGGSCFAAEQRNYICLNPHLLLFPVLYIYSAKLPVSMRRHTHTHRGDSEAQLWSSGPRAGFHPVVP